MLSVCPIRALQLSGRTSESEEKAGHAQFCFQMEKKSFLKLER